MSLRVLIIPENPTSDQYILKPVVECLLQSLGRGTAKVDVLRDPHLHSVNQALDRHVLADIVQDHPMVDLFLLIIDQDCQQGRRDAVQRKEQDFSKLLGCVAIQEVEVWLLALYAEEIADTWACVRQECHPKERYAEALLAKRASLGPGRGRKELMKRLPKAWEPLLQRCPELQELRQRVSERLRSSPG